jgi:hypothetical protein
MIYLAKWAKWAKADGMSRNPMDFSKTNRKLNLFAFSSEKTRDALVANDHWWERGFRKSAALAVLSEQPRQVFDYFKQLLAQAANPPIDPIREEIVILSDPSQSHCERLVVRHPVLTLEETKMCTPKEERVQAPGCI